MAPVKRPDYVHGRAYLAEWREEAGLSQRQVAKIIGVAASSLSRLEVGETKWNQFTIEEVAKVYKCEPYELLGFDPKKEKNLIEIVRLLKNSDEKLQQQSINVVKAIIGNETQS